MKLAGLLLVVLVGAALGLATCGEEDEEGAQPPARATTASCEREGLELVEPGRLTIGTDKPAFPPYFEDDDPSNGRGFESAVAYAIADELGFEPSEVDWTVVPFNASYAPGPKDFDFDVNQISITPKRAERVDFSEPYYTAPQAVVAPKGSPAAGATALADFADSTIGVQIGTTSLDAVSATIAPAEQPKVFNDSNDVVTALKQGQVDAVVVDLPTALYLTAAQVPSAEIVGQFDAPGGDEWGALLEKDSALTTCVSGAVDALRASGELDRITQKWMTGAAGAPELN